MCTMALSHGTGCVPWHYHMDETKAKDQPMSVHHAVWHNIPGSMLYTPVATALCRRLGNQWYNTGRCPRETSRVEQCLDGQWSKDECGQNTSADHWTHTEQRSAEECRPFNYMASVSNKDRTSHKDVDLCGQVGRNWWRSCVIIRCPYNHRCMRSSLVPPLCMAVNFGQWRLTKRGKLSQNEDAS